MAAALSADSVERWVRGGSVDEEGKEDFVGSTVIICESTSVER